MKLCKVLTNVLVTRRRAKGKMEKVLRREMHLASAQVSQYPRNSLIKQRVKPNQTPLDFSLAQRSRAVALSSSRCTQPVHQPSTLCKDCQPFLAWDHFK